jgi:hypothetical protein
VLSSLSFCPASSCRCSGSACQNRDRAARCGRNPVTRRCGLPISWPQGQDWRTIDAACRLDCQTAFAKRPDSVRTLRPPFGLPAICQIDLSQTWPRPQNAVLLPAAHLFMRFTAKYNLLIYSEGNATAGHIGGFSTPRLANASTRSNPRCAPSTSQSCITRSALPWSHGHPVAQRQHRNAGMLSESCGHLSELRFIKISKTRADDVARPSGCVHLDDGLRPYYAVIGDRQTCTVRPPDVVCTRRARSLPAGRRRTTTSAVESNCGIGASE